MVLEIKVGIVAFKQSVMPKKTHLRNELKIVETDHNTNLLYVTVKSLSV